MKIVKVEDFHADAGWRTASFLKVSTDEGLVGWSEFHETAWNPGLTLVIRKMAEHAIGQDPRKIGHLAAVLWAITRMVPGGTNQQAIAAIENACLDIKAKAQGVPVSSMFSGPYRDRIDLYWSHCGTFRVRDAEFFERVIGTPPLRKLEDFTTLGRQARAEGWKAVKTNPIVFTPKGPVWCNSGFPKDGLDLAGNWNLATVDAIAEQMAAVRAGLGPHVGLMLDLNFGMKPEGFTQVSRAVEPFGLTWLEMDVHEPQALADVRRATKVPVASLEALYGRRSYRQFLDARAVDIAIVDVIWNGFSESVRIAELAESYEINVAPHNFYGHLANLISAHFAASVPNVKIMEYEVDDVAWKADFVTVPPVIEGGALVLPKTPGWGTEINEEALRAHPPKVKR
jgi:L-alanine-DL-glutamate epimerase-like enolase superfamily enzyme